MARVRSATPRPLPRVLLFDVFGTIVDWRGSIARELAAVGRRRKVAADWEAFADRWRAGYRPAMDAVRRGAKPWRNIDALHREILDRLLPEAWLDDLDEAERAELNRAWHRLRPWPDSVRGLRRLKRGFLIATLSNGNVALLANMAKRARLPWDVILSAELFRHYKPDPETYLGAAALLGVEPGEAMLVAAHGDDLRAAAACGLRTAFVERPLEFGPNVRTDAKRERAHDFRATDLLDLAAQFGC